MGQGVGQVVLNGGPVLYKVIHFLQKLNQTVECYQSQKDQRQVAQKSVENVAIKNWHFYELFSAGNVESGPSR